MEAVFESWDSFRLFALEIKRTNRFFLSESAQLFLNTLLITCNSRIRTLSKGETLWRAQIGNDWEKEYDSDGDSYEFPAPHKAERMKPCQEFASEGRANPKGILQLYTASNTDTAIAEVRPWVGAYVSVAEFLSTKELRIIDFSVQNGNHFFFYDDEPEPEERNKAVWGSIDNAFSRPVSPKDDHTDYVPTQIIAELFKNKGFDGVIYRSSLGKGKNCCLFDVNNVEMKMCRLFQVESVSFTSAECSEPLCLS